MRDLNPWHLHFALLISEEISSACLPVASLSQEVGRVLREQPGDPASFGSVSDSRPSLLPRLCVRLRDVAEFQPVFLEPLWLVRCVWELVALRRDWEAQRVRSAASSPLRLVSDWLKASVRSPASPQIPPAGRSRSPRDPPVGEARHQYCEEPFPGESAGDRKGQGSCLPSQVFSVSNFC